MWIGFIFCSGLLNATVLTTLWNYLWLLENIQVHFINFLVIEIRHVPVIGLDWLKKWPLFKAKYHYTNFTPLFNIWKKPCRLQRAQSFCLCSALQILLSGSKQLSRASVYRHYLKKIKNSIFEEKHKVYSHSASYFNDYMPWRGNHMMDH